MRILKEENVKIFEYVDVEEVSNMASWIEWPERLIAYMESQHQRGLSFSLSLISSREIFHMKIESIS
jgi:hypothetical protein